MIRKIAKIVGWTAGGIVALAVLVYLGALAVNRSDREPSATALRLSTSYRNRPPVADADNAYIYALGFHAPRDRDPFETGLRRVAWLRAAADAPPNPEDDPLPITPDVYVSHIEALRTPCADNEIDCIEELDVSAAAFDEWLAGNGWWLERYHALLARPAWQEVVSVGSLKGPFSTYLPIGQAQIALLIEAGVLAERGDSAQVKALLASDAHFWRTVLESSDLLASKLIAVGALRRNFEWGNLALRKLPRASAAAAVPDEWRSAFSDSERSMSRVTAGEWRFASGFLSSFGIGLTANSSPSDALFAPLYQRQDTLNRLADYYGRVAELADAPLETYPATVAQASQLTEAARADWHKPSLYNLAGKMLFAAGPSDFADYAARVADLEGARRGALSAATLRIEGVQPADVPTALRTTAPRNPYDGEPLLWDEGRAAIVFHGLERGQRRDHRFYF